MQREMVNMVSMDIWVFHVTFYLSKSGLESKADSIYQVIEEQNIDVYWLRLKFTTNKKLWHIFWCTLVRYVCTL